MCVMSERLVTFMNIVCAMLSADLTMGLLDGACFNVRVCACVSRFIA